MLRLAALATFLLLTGAAAAETRGITQSWGKPNVSLADYRQDALTCGRAGYYLDISGTSQAKEFVDASKRLTDIDQSFSTSSLPAAGGQTSVDAVARQAANLAADEGQVVNTLQPDTKMKQLGTMLQSATDRCLTAHGYQRFRLTPEQSRRLAHLKIGSDERRRYLYQLAADPAVLSAQALPESDLPDFKTTTDAPSH